MDPAEKPSNKLQDHLLTLQRLLEQSELSTGLDHEIEEEMLSQIEALSESIEQPSIYTIDDSSLSDLEDSSSYSAGSADHELPILMDKIEIAESRTNRNSPNAGTNKQHRSKPGYETSTDLAVNIIDALAEIDPYITLPAKGSDDYENLSAALAKRLEKGFKEIN